MPLCERFYDPDRYRDPVRGLKDQSLKFPKVPQTATPSVVTDKPVGEYLKPRNPFKDGYWVPS